MKKYIRIVKIEFSRAREYILNFIGQLIYLPLQLIVIFFIWKFVYVNTYTINNYTFRDVISYYFILKIFETAIMPVGTTAYEIWMDINSGKLNMYLSKPLFYPLYIFCTKVGYFFWGIISGFFFLYLLKTIININVPINMSLIILSIINGFLGLIIMFCLFLIIGILTFWVKNILTLRDNLWNVIKILSGQLLPIAFFPIFIQKLSYILPFQYIYYIPISIFQGKISGEKITYFLLLQVVWAVTLIITAIVLWRKGVKNYESQGG